MLGPTSLPPCHRSPNRAFTAPSTAPARSVRAALRMCEMCPMLKGCATEAMTAGSSLDGSRIAPADDVIQGGVHCRGDAATARKLEKVAGVAAPTLRRRKPRTQAPDRCRGCQSPMIPWTRDTVPEGVSMHHARGWGVCCRAEYNNQLKVLRDMGEIGADIHRKEVDRRRHHPETITARLRTTAVAEGWTEERLAEEVGRALERVKRDRDRRTVERARKREQMVEELRNDTARTLPVE